MRTEGGMKELGYRVSEGGRRMVLISLPSELPLKVLEALYLRFQSILLN